MDEEIAPVPEGVLPEVLSELKDKILTDLDIAWIFLQQNPVAVIALSRAKKELVTVEKSINEEYNYKKFLEKFDYHMNKLFDVTKIVQEQGLALTTELLLEMWRKYNQDIRIHSMNQLLLRNLLKIHEKASSLENTPENRVIREMVFDSLKRISDLELYEKKYASDNWSVLAPELQAIIESSFQIQPVDDIPRIWKSWFGLATLNNNNAEDFRYGFAVLVLEQLKNVFPDLPETMKFKIAPWILSLERIISLKEEKKEQLGNINTQK